MRSIRKIYVTIESVTLIVALCFVLILIVLLRDHVRNGYINDLTSDISKIDILIEGFVGDSVAAFKEHIKLNDRDAALRILSNFSDIYHVNDRLGIDRIIKKDEGSQIFRGYDTSGSNLGAFLRKIRGAGFAYSPVYRSSENEKLGFYIAARDKDGFIVGRIGLDKLLDSLSRVAEYSRSVIMIATSDGYVISSSNKQFPLSVLPQAMQEEIGVDGKQYLLSRVPSKVFDNDIVILAPLSNVYGILTSMTRYYVFFAIFITAAFLVKVFLQTKLFIRPLADFGTMLQRWDVEKGAQKVSHAFLEYEEISTLYDLFLQKSSAIRDAIESIRLSEQEVDRIRLYLKNIIDSMPSLLVGVDKDGNVTQWNMAAQKATGVGPDEARGQPLDRVLPALSRKLESVHRAMGKRAVETEVKMARTVEGETRYEDVTIYPLVSNGVEGAVIRVDDVTDRVRIEEMMIQSEKMLSVGGLAAGMAHEINNPLGVIMQASQNVLRRVSPDLPANEQAARDCGTTLSAVRSYLERREVLTFLEDIRQSGQRSAQIVSNMLSFSRKADGAGTPVDMAELLDRTVSLAESDYDLKKSYDFRQIEMVREYEQGMPMAVCQPSKIQQVFLNILRNGAEAMRADSSVDRWPRFTLRIRRDGVMVRVEIEDNGPGMDEATRKRVFEPFFTTKSPGSGTGLGLSVSYFIITEDHGGTMYVESSPGAGTNFIIRLPLMETAP